MGLDELAPFKPEERIIEYLKEPDDEKLIGMSLSDFADETASESPAPVEDPLLPISVLRSRPGGNGGEYICQKRTGNHSVTGRKSIRI
jgi:hypothetical protein